MTVEPTIREQLVAAGRLKDQSWDDWKRDLIGRSAVKDMPDIDPDEYRDYYDDGYGANDAWAEDLRNGY